MAENGSAENIKNINDRGIIRVQWGIAFWRRPWYFGLRYCAALVREAEACLSIYR